LFEMERTLRRRRVVYEGFDYRSFWADAGRRHLDRLEHRVVEELLPPDGVRILDLGCGFGRLTDAYVDRFRQVVLVDAAGSLLEQARRRWGRRIRVVQADLRQLPFADATFDAVVMVRVLHHLADPGTALREVRRVMAPGARLVGNVSNKRNAVRMARALARGSLDPWRSGLERYGPPSFGCHPKDAEAWLLDAGLLPLRWRGVGVFDKVARWVPEGSSLIPLGTRASRALGRIRLAPSLFVQAVALPAETA
jgi:SAM-dependent methyltransferase